MTFRRFKYLIFISIVCIGPLSNQAISKPYEARINNTLYWDLEYVAQIFGLQTSWIKQGQEIRLFSKKSDLRFKLHKRDYLHNRSKVYLGYAIALHKKSLHISKSDVRKVLIPLLVPAALKKTPKLYRIVLDPGHGGKDPGTQSKKYGLDEKDLVLKVAKKLRPLLQSKGYKVYMTRESDSFVSLKKRAQISNELGADLFLSLHFNATGTQSVHGVETYLYTPPFQPSSSRVKFFSSDKIIQKGNKYDDWNMISGYIFQKRLVKNLRFKDRGVKKARFQVLRDLNSPGMLLELGFLSNHNTARSLMNDRSLQSIAKSISDAVNDYQKMLNYLRSIR